MKKNEDTYLKNKKVLDPVDALHVMYHEKFLDEDRDPLWFLHPHRYEPLKTISKVNASKSSSEIVLDDDKAA